MYISTFETFFHSSNLSVHANSLKQLHENEVIGSKLGIIKV